MHHYLLNSKQWRWTIASALFAQAEPSYSQLRAGAYITYAHRTMQRIVLSCVMFNTLIQKTYGALGKWKKKNMRQISFSFFPLCTLKKRPSSQCMLLLRYTIQAVWRTGETTRSSFRIIFTHKGISHKCYVVMSTRTMGQNIYLDMYVRTYLKMFS